MIGRATKAAFEDQGVDTRRSGIIYAIGAAALFGASTPLAKGLLGQISPVLLQPLGRVPRDPEQGGDVRQRAPAVFEVVVTGLVPE